MVLPLTSPRDWALGTTSDYRGYSEVITLHGPPLTWGRWEGHSQALIDIWKRAVWDSACRGSECCVTPGKIFNLSDFQESSLSPYLAVIFVVGNK